MTPTTYLRPESGNNGVWCRPCTEWVMAESECPHMRIRYQSFGALARAEALAVGYADWMNVTAWPPPSAYDRTKARPPDSSAGASDAPSADRGTTS